MLAAAEVVRATSCLSEWKDAQRFEINGIKFFATIDPAEYQNREQDQLHDELLLIKSRSMIEKVFSLHDHAEPKIFEMGIWRGGSVALYDQAFRPAKLVAIEWHNEAVRALSAYIQANDRAEIVRPYYGINQADPQRMRNILGSEFPDRDISIVIDDASHFYEETKQAFNIVFPYLRPGGYYVVEDWAWAHWRGENWNRDYFKGKPALTNLLFELCMLAATRPDIVASIEVLSHMFIVKKGNAPLPLSGWDISNEYIARGAPFTPVI
jgi:hypothetical protein